MKLHPLLFALLIAPSAMAADDPTTGLVSRVQERLTALGFYGGEVNGDLGGDTQAALAQFQLSVPMPAGGQLDDATLQQLGVAREDVHRDDAGESAASGASGT